MPASLPPLFRLKYLALLAGPILYVLLTCTGILPLDIKIVRVIGVSAWMLVWWVSEALPVPATALLPLVLFPFLNILDLNATAVNYANPTIFLYMAGFILALAMEKHSLHIRIALHIVKFVGTDSNRLVLGFMIATAFVSMWVNNTAAALLMLPIATSVLKLMEGEFDRSGHSNEFRNFSVSLLLGLAYCASIGGITTIIGTPTNTVMIGYFKQVYQVDISFMGWFVVGFPLAVLLLVACYFILVKLLFRTNARSLPDASLIINQKIGELGKMTFQEYAVSIIFILTATGWIFRSLIADWLHTASLNDTVIGLIGALLLFMVPDKKSKSGFLFDWEGMTKLSWGILLLIGGGLALAKAFETSGLAKVTGNAIAASGMYGYIPLLVILTAITLTLKQFIGNTALATIALPMVAGVAASVNIHPILLAAPVTFACSFAFMLPTSTPPNAIVFTTGHVRIKDMMLAGTLLTLTGWVLLLAASGIYHWMERF